MRFSLITALIALLVFPLLKAGAEDTVEFQKISLDKPAEYKNFPVVEFSIYKNKSTVHYLKITDSAPGTSYKRSVFLSQKAKQGTKFKIRSYLVSQSLVEAQLSIGKDTAGPFYKGEDAPQIQQILQSFKNTDTKEFMKTVAKLAEVRRSAESNEELEKVAQKMEGKTNVSEVEMNLWRSQIFYGTGFIEVEEDSKTTDADFRKFIPMNDVVDGKVKIDLKTAQVEIVKSTILYFMNSEFPWIQETDRPTTSKKTALKEEMDKMLTGCATANCVIDSNTFSTLMEDILKTGVVDNTAGLDIMDEDYDKKLSPLQFKKLEHLRDQFLKVCPKNKFHTQ